MSDRLQKAQEDLNNRIDEAATGMAEARNARLENETDLFIAEVEGWLGRLEKVITDTDRAARADADLAADLDVAALEAEFDHHPTRRGPTTEEMMSLSASDIVADMDVLLLEMAEQDAKWDEYIEGFVRSYEQGMNESYIAQLASDNEAGLALQDELAQAAEDEARLDDPDPNQHLVDICEANRE